MNSNITGGKAIHIIGAGHGVFAATMIALGLVGLINGDFSPIWGIVPKGLPAREVLAYVCACISLGCGIGLFWARAAAGAARLLLVYLVIWLLLVRLPQIAPAPAVLGSWYGGVETAVVAAGAWVLYTQFSPYRKVWWFAFAAGDKGLRVARALYGLALVFFGTSHFVYLSLTTPLVPGWLPAPAFWAYFFGCTYVAAGVAVLFSVFARLAAVLAAVQMGLFTLLVWVPMLAAGSAHSVTGTTWAEFVVSWTLTAAGWVVADSYRRTPWLAVGKR